MACPRRFLTLSLLALLATALVVPLAKATPATGVPTSAEWDSVHELATQEGSDYRFFLPLVHRYILASEPDGPGWHPRSSLLTARYSLGAAVLSGKTYAAGGYNQTNGYLKVVEEYDRAGDTWTTRAPMTNSRANFAIASTADRVYVFGGSTPEYSGGPPIALDAVESYNPVTDIWSARAPMPTARNGARAAVAANGKIYVIGGYRNMGFPIATVEEYDPVTDSWQTKTPMPTGRTMLTVVAAGNGRIYAIGGMKPSPTLDPMATSAVEEYDPATDTWATKAALPTARHSAAGVLGSNGKIYVIGGWDTSQRLSVVEVYDPATNTWAGFHALPTARGSLGAAALPGRIYAIGGEDGSALATLEMARIGD